MSKVKVSIEEHLCKTIEIEAPDNLDENEAMEYAENEAREMYENEEIILTADDHNGVVLMQIELEDGTCTEWYDM